MEQENTPGMIIPHGLNHESKVKVAEMLPMLNIHLAKKVISFTDTDIDCGVRGVFNHWQFVINLMGDKFLKDYNDPIQTTGHTNIDGITSVAYSQWKRIMRTYVWPTPEDEVKAQEQVDRLMMMIG